MSKTPIFNIERWIKTHIITNKQTHDIAILKRDIDLIRNQVNKSNLIKHLTDNGWQSHKENDKLYSYVKTSPHEEEEEHANNTAVPSVPDKEVSPLSSPIISRCEVVKHVYPSSHIKSANTSISSFNIETYKRAYEKQLLFINENSETYDIMACFNSALAVYTNTVLYNDLPLKMVEEFENEIEWESVRESQSSTEKTEYIKPFITHLNPTTHTLITSLSEEDYKSNKDLTYGLLMMSNIAKKHNFTYCVAMNTDNMKIKSICDMLSIPTKNVIILNAEAIHAICQQLVIAQPPPSTLPDQSSTSNIISLRQYQIDYIEYMRHHKTAIFKLPCGMGKSLIMIYHMMI